MFTFKVIRYCVCLAVLWLSILVFVQVPDVSGVPTVPVISGGAFVPFVQAGQTTLVSIFSPVVLVPLVLGFAFNLQVRIVRDFALFDFAFHFTVVAKRDLLASWKRKHYDPWQQ